MAITHEYEIAWKRVLHYFDLHLNKRLNKQPPCWLLNALRRRQVTVMASRITGQSNVCSTVRSDCQHRNIKGPRYCPFVMRIHCDRWFPTQKESNMENASIWWRHNGLKDTMTAHVSYYAIFSCLRLRQWPVTYLITLSDWIMSCQPGRHAVVTVCEPDWKHKWAAYKSFDETSSFNNL